MYKHLIIPNFDHLSVDFDFTANMLVAYQNMQNHRKFMRQACRYKDQNNLKDYIFYHCYSFDLAWYQLLFKGPLPTEVLLACQYHAHACTHLTLKWIEDGTYDYQEIVESIVNTRKASLNPLFKKHNKPEPNIKHFFIFKLLFLNSVSILLAELVFFFCKISSFLLINVAFIRYKF